MRAEGGGGARQGSRAAKGRAEEAEARAAATEARLAQLKADGAGGSGAQPPKRSGDAPSARSVGLDGADPGGGGSASETDGPASESEGRLPPGSDDGSGGEGEGAAARAAREHAARLQARVDALERELRSAAQARRRAPGPRRAALC